jgi:peptidoglycan hydrolase-like protein with peptidoglycan-binding domain
VESDPLVGPDSPSALIRLLQSELNKRDYDCGAEDGRFGTLTRAAVLALKANEGLETTTPAIRLSAVMSAEPWIIADRQEKSVKDLKRDGDPGMTFTARIKAGAAWLLGLFGLGGGATAIKGAGDGTSFFDRASDALGLWERLQMLVAPFADVARFAVQWLWLPALLALIATWLLSHHCERARLDAYKAARML